MHSQQAFKLLTMLLLEDTEIDILSEIIPDNYNKMRNKTSLPKAQVFRDSSMSFTKFSVVYYERIKYNNTINKNIDMDEDSPILFYETSQEKVIQVSKAADPNNNILNKHVNINWPTTNIQYAPTEHPNLVSSYGNNAIINIQLPYDPNIPTEPDL